MRRLWLVWLAVLLIAVAGCTMHSPFQPPLTVATVVQYTHPVAKLGGFPVSLRVDGGTGKYTVDWGDGVIDDSLSHLYTAPIKNQYIITVKSGGAVKTVSVDVINAAPQVSSPDMLLPVEMRVKEFLDFRYREHGCKNGTAQYVTGVWDPDGDKVTLVIHAYVDGIENPIFDENGDPIHGSVPIGVYYWFPGWTKTTTPYPFKSDVVDGVIDVTATDQWGATTHHIYTFPIAAPNCK